MTLREIIELEIRERGPIPFSRYMEMCLYHPKLGYYARNAEQFGKAGDFYTSSDVHAVFGRLLARQFDEMWRSLGSPTSIEVLELGPGRGLFAQDVLDWSEKKFPEFLQSLHYSLAESSPSLREKLQEILKRHFESGKASLASTVDAGLNPSHVRDCSDSAAQRRQNATHGASREYTDNQEQAPKGRKSAADVAMSAPDHMVDVAKSIPDHMDPAPEGRHDLSPALLALGEGDNAIKSRRDDRNSHAIPTAGTSPRILFANEFFDALPVEILGHEGSLRISTQNGRFVETWVPSSADELEFLDRYSVHPEPGERIEVPLLAQQFMCNIAASIQNGFCVIIDYGYTRAEQLAGRHRGTVMTYRQHSASPNPYEAPGEQDITAHVNFTALAAAAERGGMHAHELRTQSQFLMGIGENNQFADAFEDARLPQERAKVALQLKHLVTPAGMGESFHVLLGSKNADATNLTGLTFGKSQFT